MAIKQNIEKRERISEAPKTAPKGASEVLAAFENLEKNPDSLAKTTLDNAYLEVAREIAQDSGDIKPGLEAILATKIEEDILPENLA